MSPAGNGLADVALVRLVLAPHEGHAVPSGITASWATTGAKAHQSVKPLHVMIFKHNILYGNHCLLQNMEFFL